MARVLATVKIFPSDPEVDLDSLADKVERGLPEGFKLHGKETEPLAFGMKVLLVGISMPDAEGYSSKLEEYLKGLKEVDEITILNVQRI
ncbi:MAG: elongation factor 1-beta [Nitrososphaeria archaeon]